jgi:hypothetical protein
MNQNIKPIGEIAFLNTGLLLLGESGQRITSIISDCSLESIQGMAFHLGGEFIVRKVEISESMPDRFLFFGTFRTKIKNVELSCNFSLTEISHANQVQAFSSDTFICEQGTRLTIIDNSYFVF